MTMIFAAVALSIALPAMANAEAPAPAPSDAKKRCCKDISGSDKSQAGPDIKPSTDAPNNRP